MFIRRCNVKNVHIFWNIFIVGTRHDHIHFTLNIRVLLMNNVEQRNIFLDFNFYIIFMWVHLWIIKIHCILQYSWFLSLRCEVFFTCKWLWLKNVCDINFRTNCCSNNWKWKLGRDTIVYQSRFLSSQMFIPQFPRFFVPDVQIPD